MDPRTAMFRNARDQKQLAAQVPDYIAGAHERNRAMGLNRQEDVTQRPQRREQQKETLRFHDNAGEKGGDSNVPKKTRMSYFARKRAREEREEMQQQEHPGKQRQQQQQGDMTSSQTFRPPVRDEKTFWKDVHGLKLDDILTFDRAVRQTRYRPEGNLLERIEFTVGTFREENYFSTRELAEALHAGGIKSIWFAPRLFFGSEDTYLQKMRVKTVQDAFNALPSTDGTPKPIV